MRVLKTALVVFFSLFAAVELHAQIIADPTTWTFEAKKKSVNEYQLIFHVKLKKGWHIWSLHPGGDGLEIAPEFTFEKSAKLKLKDSIKEHGKIITGMMEGVDGAPASRFEGNVDYVQNCTITGNTTIKGTYMYQVCDEHMCLPPKTRNFSIEIKDAGGSPESASETTTGTTALNKTVDSMAANSATKNDGTVVGDTTKDKKVAAVKTTDSKSEGDKKGTKSLLWLFLAAFGGGLAAVITPCVYSMIPITVSFFTKRSKTRAEAIRNASYYSLSIIIIFTLLGVLISAIFGSNALNSLSTNWIANLFFFIIFVVFAISFLGAFEITLPSSWTNKTDSRAGVGSFSGIFFMALTLVIVSFSCTGPIVGPMLVLAG